MDFKKFSSLNDLNNGATNDRYKETIYIVNGNVISDKAKKTLRRKIRTFADNTLCAIAAMTEKNAEKFALEFADFYNEVYKVNDYSFASISANEEKKATYTKALNMIEKIVKAQSNKANEKSNKK
jgi:hypothetical protein